MTFPHTVQEAAPVEPRIVESLEKCLWAFARPADRTLLVTSIDAAVVRLGGGAISAAMIIPADGAAQITATHDGTRRETGATDRFDTVLLDRCWEDDQSHAPHSWLAAIRRTLAPDGRLLVIGSRRRSAAARRSLVAHGFRVVEAFALVPGIMPMHHLVSTEARAMRTFMLRAHGLPTIRPDRVTQWPKWLAVLCGADRLRLQWFLLHARA